MNGERNSYNPKQYTTGTMALPAPVTFHIIHVDDITKSKITKLEEWKRFKDPNEVGVDRLNKGKIINEIREDSGTDEQRPALTQSVFKLTLKDMFDNYCFAYEYNDQLAFLRPTANTQNTPIPIKLGGRLVVKQGTTISNGALLLTRNQCSYLGVDPNSQLVKALNSNLVEKSIDILQNPEL